MSVDDDWDEMLHTHHHTPSETLSELAYLLYLEGRDDGHGWHFDAHPSIGHMFGLQLYYAVEGGYLDDETARPYVDALERALAGEDPRWT